MLLLFFIFRFLFHCANIYNIKYIYNQISRCGMVILQWKSFMIWKLRQALIWTSVNSDRINSMVKHFPLVWWFGSNGIRWMSNEQWVMNNQFEFRIPMDAVTHSSAAMSHFEQRRIRRRNEKFSCCWKSKKLNFKLWFFACVCVCVS